MIFIDNRIGSKEFEGKLSSPHNLCTLDFADFMWIGNGPEGTVSVGVERKALTDFLNSMTTGRLSGHQLIGLKEQFDIIYILIEGVWKPNYKTGVIETYKGKRWGAVRLGQRRFMIRELNNYINTLQVICGIHVVITNNKADTAMWLDNTYKWWSKRWEDHNSHLQFQKPTVGVQLVKPNLVTRIASQFEGVGWKKAREIGKSFSVEGFMAAGIEELVKVDGIGKGIAESIIKQRETV